MDGFGRQDGYRETDFEDLNTDQESDKESMGRNEWDGPCSRSAKEMLG